MYNTGERSGIPIHTTKVKLTTRGLKGLANQIEKYSKDLNKKMDTFVKRVGALGVSLGKAEAVKLDIPSEVVAAIHLEPGDTVISGSSIKVVCDSDIACYWEFGTGIVGEHSPHPQPDGEWEYDSNKHGDKGWVYVASQGDLTKWSWELKDGVYRTKGMPAQPFMWNTYQGLTREYLWAIEKIAKEVFGE